LFEEVVRLLELLLVATLAGRLVQLRTAHLLLLLPLLLLPLLLLPLVLLLSRGSDSKSCSRRGGNCSRRPLPTAAATVVTATTVVTAAVVASWMGLRLTDRWPLTNVAFAGTVLAAVLVVHARAVRGLIPGIAPTQAVALTALLVLALDGAAAGTKVASFLPMHVPTGARLAPRIEAPLSPTRWAWLRLFCLAAGLFFRLLASRLLRLALLLLRLATRLFLLLLSGVLAPVPAATVPVPTAALLVLLRVRLPVWVDVALLRRLEVALQLPVRCRLR